MGKTFLLKFLLLEADGAKLFRGGWDRTAVYIIGMSVNGLSNKRNKTLHTFYSIRICNAYALSSIETIARSSLRGKYLASFFMLRTKHLPRQ